MTLNSHFGILRRHSPIGPKDFQWNGSLRAILSIIYFGGVFTIPVLSECVTVNTNCEVLRIPHARGLEPGGIRLSVGLEGLARHHP